MKTINQIQNGAETYIFDSLSEEKRKEIGILLNKQGMQALNCQAIEEFIRGERI